jgi:hypothetical protein
LIIKAETGVYMEDVDPSSSLVAVGIEESRDRGLHLVNASPSVIACGMSGTGDPGNGHPGVNVRIEGSSSQPSFTSTWMSGAYRVNQGGNWYGGHGVEITEAAEIYFLNCVALNNEHYGFYIHRGSGGTYGPYLDHCRVDGNLTGIYIHEVRRWTTLRNSRVHGHTNGYGILLQGTDDEEARIRGWYHTDPNIDYPSGQEVNDIVTFGWAEGRNCLFQNNLNAVSYSFGRFDLGSAYPDFGGVQTTLGGINSLFDPQVQQGYVDWYSYGGFREVWWDNRLDMFDFNGSTLDMSNELQVDEVGCTEFGKSTGGLVAPVAELLRYRRTRGVAGTTPPSTGSLPQAPAQTISLSAAYPNPFNPSTSIAVTLYAAQDVHLYISDALGRRVATLASGRYDAGRYSMRFDGSGLPSGVYFIVLRGAESVQTRQILLTK